MHDLVVTSGPGTPQLVMVGHFEDTVDFGGTPVQSAGSRDIFVASWGLDGTANWALAMGDETDQFESDHELNTWLNLETADDGSIWVAGAFSGELPFVPVTLTSAGKTDLFLIQLDQAGNYLGARRFGDEYSDYLLDLDLVGSDLIPIVGRHASRPGFDLGVAGQVKGAGSFDGFLAQIPQW